jgi:hypothetical protein
VVEFPFAGPGAKPFDPAVRQRAVAALSGVAAAALVIAGLASTGGHQSPKTTSALGHPAGHGGTVAPNPAGTIPTPAPLAGIDGNAPAGTTTFTGTGGSTPSVVFATQHVSTAAPMPSGATVGTGSPPAGSGSGTTPPPPPPPDGGGTTTGLAPATAIVGDLVSATGSSVSSASGQVASVVPRDPGLVTTVMETGNNITLLGQSMATPTGL